MRTVEHERADALAALSAGYAAELLSTATLEARVERVLRARAPREWLWDLPAGAPGRRSGRGPRTLIVVEHGVTIARVRIPAGPATLAIGRDRESWLRLRDTSVSRRHALLSRRGSACRIRDLGSTNGTCVNGAAVTVADLEIGDEVRIGAIVLGVR